MSVINQHAAVQLYVKHGKEARVLGQSICGHQGAVQQAPKHIQDLQTSNKSRRNGFKPCLEMKILMIAKYGCLLFFSKYNKKSTTTSRNKHINIGVEFDTHMLELKEEPLNT